MLGVGVSRGTSLVENSRRVAVALSFASGVAGLVGWGHLGGITGVACGTHIAAWLLSPTRALRFHWRTLPVGAWSVLCCGVYYQSTSRSAVIGLSVLHTVLAAIAAGVLWLLPVPPPAELVGPHPVGTTSWNTADPTVVGRVIPCQAWYPLRPIAAAEGHAVLWTSGGADQLEEACLLYPVLAKMARLPAWLFAHLVLGVTNSVYIPEAKAATSIALTGGPRRVVVYSHGKFAWRQMDHRACEVLANLGFVVVAVDHAPDGALSRPHGRLDDAQYAEFTAPDDASPEDDHRFYEAGVRRRAHELAAGLDHVLQGKLFGEGAVHVDEVGAWGHSYGGAAVASFSSQDARVRAAVLLDPWLYPMPPAQVDRGPAASTLILSAHRWEWGPWQIPFRDHFCRKQPGPRSFVVRGTSHQNFCETATLCRHRLLHQPNICGPTDPSEVSSIVCGLLVGHMIEHLGEPHGLSDDGPAEGTSPKTPPSSQPQDPVTIALIRAKADECWRETVLSHVTAATEMASQGHRPKYETFNRVMAPYLGKNSS